MTINKYDLLSFGGAIKARAKVKYAKIARFSVNEKTKSTLTPKSTLTHSYEPLPIKGLHHKLSSKIVLISVFGCLSVLTGCTDRVMIAEESMATIRASAAQPVSPPPAPELVEEYTYEAIDVRSPFVATSQINQQLKAANNEGVAPDLTRIKQPLESFELSNLTYRGILVSPDGEKFGLVQRPDGVVDSVKMGDYMGMYDGRIVEITPTQINLIEIVPDNRAGFIEKPASVVSPI